MNGARPLVDDDLDLLDLISVSLIDAGCEVIQADSGEQALLSFSPSPLTSMSGCAGSVTRREYHLRSIRRMILPCGDGMCIPTGTRF